MLGYAVASGGDYDGDGLDDVLVECFPTGWEGKEDFSFAGSQIQSVGGGDISSVPNQISMINPTGGNNGCLLGCLLGGDYSICS